MRLVAVSIVKNEADIIEAFVRHTRAWVDHHLIFDHDSTDGTREILGALQQEGLPLTLYTDGALGNLQQARSNFLTRLAAQQQSADWILPLDADEILTGPGRAALEIILPGCNPAQPASLSLLNYFPTQEDDAQATNPVLRLRHCESSAPRTKKIMVPRALALDGNVAAGKGSHALYRGTEAVPDQPLPVEYHLAHLAQRSPQHQVLRVVLAELQKLSRGQAHAGLDVHYRLGFQLLAQDPGMFLATIYPPQAGLRLLPIAYQGSALRYTESLQDQPSPGLGLTGWNRVARALLPYLEKLAASHGRLLDAGASPAPDMVTAAAIREIPAADLPLPSARISGPAFGGFAAQAGWGALEGPVPAAFLPPFHWGYAPATSLTIVSADGRPGRLVAEALTYSDKQNVTIELNGAPVLRHAFSRVNQKETLAGRLPLRAGENQLVLRYTECLQTAQDARKLAVIFLSLRILPAESP
jgi:hypothetical protein